MLFNALTITLAFVNSVIIANISITLAFVQKLFVGTINTKIDTQRFGGDCKFLSRNICVYKHDNQTKSSRNEIANLESEIRGLETEVFKLKSIIQIKEKELEKKVFWKINFVMNRLL